MHTSGRAIPSSLGNTIKKEEPWKEELVRLSDKCFRDGCQKTHSLEDSYMLGQIRYNFCSHEHLMEQLEEERNKANQRFIAELLKSGEAIGKTLNR